MPAPTTAAGWPPTWPAPSRERRARRRRGGRRCGPAAAPEPGTTNPSAVGTAIERVRGRVADVGPVAGTDREVAVGRRGAVGRRLHADRRDRALGEQCRQRGRVGGGDAGPGEPGVGHDQHPVGARRGRRAPPGRPRAPQRRQPLTRTASASATISPAAHPDRAQPGRRPPPRRAGGPGRAPRRPAADPAAPIARGARRVGQRVVDRARPAPAASPTGHQPPASRRR